jgi:hypothetical protein
MRTTFEEKIITKFVDLGQFQGHPQEKYKNAGNSNKNIQFG